MLVLKGRREMNKQIAALYEFGLMVLALDVGLWLKVAEAWGWI